MELRPFDRNLTLRELLAGIPGERLTASLRTLLGTEFRLLAEDGAVLLGAAGAGPGAGGATVTFDLEPVGRIEAQADAAALQAAAGLLELLLAAAARYHMAADLHLEAVHADYEALMQKHEALMASEARYRALAEQLEQRVQEQVGQIEQAQRQLYQAERLASVGQLAAGVAHEINNPIGFIRSNLGTGRAYLERIARLDALVKEHADPELARLWQREDMDFLLEDFAALLRESVEGADRVARIVADLKDFSNVDRTEEEMADVNDCLRAAANMLRNVHPGRAEPTLELGTLPRIRCLPGHLNQAFLNLLRNAAQATVAGGTIRVQSALTDGQIRLRIADTGCGIAPEHLSRIFDPFFTTRGVGEGVGLGLTLSRDIVRAHKGRLEVESRPGQGTVATVWLPVAG